jgi:hypothetical protein
VVVVVVEREGSGVAMHVTHSSQCYLNCWCLVLEPGWWWCLVVVVVIVGAAETKRRNYPNQDG